mmetsp:Transcript_38786/g.77626  ORF Transcript_38786/g.77626 Transcript_38786/m.77626 type:complete len:431 (-) Transcript_38786:898-2190(-)
MAGLYVAAATLFVTNWAPGLALRGPTGSLTRAFDAVMYERNSINFWYCFTMITYVLQTILCIFVMDNTEGWSISSIICTPLGLLCLLAASIKLNNMKSRFFFYDEIDSERAHANERRVDDARTLKQRSADLVGRIDKERQALGQRIMLSLHRGGRKPDGVELDPMVDAASSDDVTGDAFLLGPHSPKSRLMASQTPSEAGSSTSGAAQSPIKSPQKKVLFSENLRRNPADLLHRSALRLQAVHRGRVARENVKSIKLIKEANDDESEANGQEVNDQGAKGLGVQGPVNRSIQAGRQACSGEQAPSGTYPAKHHHHRRGSLGIIDDPLQVVSSNPDVMRAGRNHNIAFVEDAQDEHSIKVLPGFEIAGYLYKKAGIEAGEMTGGIGWFGKARRGSIAARKLGLINEWQRRFVALRAGAVLMCAWQSERQIR